MIFSLNYILVVSQARYMVSIASSFMNSEIYNKDMPTLFLICPENVSNSSSKNTKR